MSRDIHRRRVPRPALVGRSKNPTTKESPCATERPSIPNTWRWSGASCAWPAPSRPRTRRSTTWPRSRTAMDTTRVYLPLRVPPVVDAALRQCASSSAPTSLIGRPACSAVGLESPLPSWINHACVNHDLLSRRYARLVRRVLEPTLALRDRLQLVVRTSASSSLSSKASRQRAESLHLSTNLLAICPEIGPAIVPPGLAGMPRRKPRSQIRASLAAARSPTSPSPPPSPAAEPPA